MVSKMELKERNKEILKLYEKGLTQQEIANNLGVNRTTIWRVLKGFGVYSKTRFLSCLCFRDFLFLFSGLFSGFLVCFLIF